MSQAQSAKALERLNRQMEEDPEGFASEITGMFAASIGDCPRARYAAAAATKEFVREQNTAKKRAGDSTDDVGS